MKILKMNNLSVNDREFFLQLYNNNDPLVRYNIVGFYYGVVGIYKGIFKRELDKDEMIIRWIIANVSKLGNGAVSLLELFFKEKYNVNINKYYTDIGKIIDEAMYETDIHKIVEKKITKN